MGRIFPDAFVMDKAMQEAQMSSPTDNRAWHLYDSGPENLDKYLKRALRGINFNSIAQAALWLTETAGRKPTGLEIAGQGKTFAKLKIAGVANCLAVPEFLIDQTKKTKHPRRRYASPSVTFVPGDIAQPSTWDEIRGALEEESIQSPNLLLFTPACGMSSMPTTPEFYEGILDQSLSVADTGPVVMVGEMDTSYSHRLEYRLIAMQTEHKAQISIIAGQEYGLFALKKIDDR